MNDHLHINGINYTAPMVMEELMQTSSGWKTKGLEFLMQLLDPSEALVKFNTSGTTGTPKEISFSKRQIVESAANTCRFFNIKAGDQLLLCLPAEFVAGRMMIARAFFAGAKLVWVEPSLNPLKEMEEADFAAFTPAQVATILNDSETRRIFGNIKKIIIGGGDINSTLEKELLQFNNEIYATYGMTETLTHVAVRRIGENRFYAVHREIIFSVNDEHCLQIELPFISNRKIITHDIVELIDSTSFIWKGRLDNMINSGGIKIGAEELERKIMEAGILKPYSFYITAGKDNIFGEVPVIVMLKDIEEVDVAALLQNINQVLNKHEAVKHIVFFDKFERTETGKIKRGRI